MLIQVMISGTLMTFLALAGASMMKDLWMESASLESKSGQMNFSEMIMQRLATPELCRHSLINKSDFRANQDRPLEIRMGSDANAPVAKSGAVLKDWNLRIQVLTFVDTQLAVSSFAGETIYLGDIELQSQATAGKKMPYRSKKVGSLFVKVDDSTREITDCYLKDSAGNVAAHTCQSLGGVFDPKTQVCDLEGVWKDLFADLGSCPKGQVMNGFTSRGNLSCAKGGGDEEPADDSKTTICSYEKKKAFGFLGCGNLNLDKTTCCPSGKTSSCIRTDTRKIYCGQDDGRSSTVTSYTCTCS